MNLWQIVNQIVYLLQQQKWGSTSTPVFHPMSVVPVAADSDADALDARLIMPMALVIPESGESDPAHGEEPDHKARRITVALITRNENDLLGTGALMGAVRSGVASSRGRGVAEFEEELFNAIKKLVVVNGITISLKGLGESGTRKDPDDNSYAFQEYQFEAFCGSSLYYPSGRKFRAQEKTGEIGLTWQNAPTRYDLYRARIIRKAGSSAPTSVSDGTELTLGSNLPTSFADSGLAAGTYSYALFMSYDDFAESRGAANPGSDLRTSESVVVEGVQAF